MLSARAFGLTLVGCGGFLVFVDHALFHDEEDVLGLADVLERVAGHGDNVGEFVGFESADFVRDAKQIGIGGGASLESSGGLHTKIDHLVKLFRVAAMRINSGVRAQSDLDALGEGPLKRAVHCVDSQVGFCGWGRWHVDVAIKFFLKTLRSHQSWNEIGAALHHHVQIFVVHKTAMLDGVDACSNGALGGFGAVGVGGSFSAE